jgi:hypothetical protein
LTAKTTQTETASTNAQSQQMHNCLFRVQVGIPSGPWVRDGGLAVDENCVASSAESATYYRPDWNSNLTPTKSEQPPLNKQPPHGKQTETAAVDDRQECGPAAGTLLQETTTDCRNCSNGPKTVSVQIAMSPRIPDGRPGPSESLFAFVAPESTAEWEPISPVSKAPISMPGQINRPP